MNIQELLLHLRKHRELPLVLALPNGSLVPAHFHITEVGYVMKRFVDCGGTRRVQETCLLQTWVHDDLDHRLHAGKLADIFERARDIVPHDRLTVEIEHELESATQFSVEHAAVAEGGLVLQLGPKHTDCLARGICLPNTCAPTPPPFVSSKGSSCCDPKSGCC